LKIKTKGKFYLYAFLILATLIVWGYALYSKNKQASNYLTGDGFAPSTPLTQIWIESKLLNLGIHKLNTPVSATFEFKNIGLFPLTIYDVTTDCSCTVSEWKKSAIMPNEEFHVRFVYNGKISGFFQKKGIIKGNIPNGVLVVVMRGEME
jgi:hypothetical protein